MRRTPPAGRSWPIPAKNVLFLVYTEHSTNVTTQNVAFNERERQTDRQRHRDRQTNGDRETDRHTETERT